MVLAHILIALEHMSRTKHMDERHKENALLQPCRNGLQSTPVYLPECCVMLMQHGLDVKRPPYYADAPGQSQPRR